MADIPNEGKCMGVMFTNVPSLQGNHLLAAQTFWGSWTAEKQGVDHQRPEVVVNKPGDFA